MSDGGLLVAVAEMALAGSVGVALTPDRGHAFWFGEDQARYVLATRDAPACSPPPPPPASPRNSSARQAATV